MKRKPPTAFEPLTLTKGRFLMALECPRKLDYARDPRFHDSGADNELLESLGEGGLQVGELARRMFPGGVLIDAPGQVEQLRLTTELLRRQNVTIFEATIRAGNLLVRIDILEKAGNRVRLLEVKAKGIWPDEDRFTTRRGLPSAEWRPYLFDVAFQAHVLSLAFPEFEITPHLLLLDKRRTVSFDGLNRMFAIEFGKRRQDVRVSGQFDLGQLDPPLLTAFDVSQEVHALRAGTIDAPGVAENFDGFIGRISQTLASGDSFPVDIGPQCKACQYYVEPGKAAAEAQSGWARCMEASGRVPANTRRAETVFGLFRLGAKNLSDHLASDQSLRLDGLAAAEIDDTLDTITPEHRRQLQIGEACGRVTGPLMLRRLAEVMPARDGRPIHFLDFETARPALPHHHGRRPYDLLLFQYSQHVLHADGRLEHRSQFLDANPGSAPSTYTVRALKAALSTDVGPVVHWSPYEATVLKEIRRQIEAAPPADADELIAFIDSLVGTEERPGRLYDLAKTVAAHVYFPGTGGSSSIKRVLPAVLRYSDYIRGKFGKPVYGTAEMPSLNFRDWNWIRMRDGQVVDPYELLDPLLEIPGVARRLAAEYDDEDDIPESFVANGGGALLAYDRLQQLDLPPAERQSLERQLLRYCELDTLAMAMVFMALTSR